MHYFVVFGNPIAHSLSPVIFNTFFEKMKLPARYSKFLLEHGKSPIKALRSHGFSGANVTLPFKEIAFAECDEVRGIAKEIGTVNTLVNENGKVIGYNTDAEGFYRVVSKRLSPKNALVIGAGGSAKAIAYILRQHQIPLTIINRSKQRLQEFEKAGYHTALSADFIPSAPFDLIINATSAGLRDDELPLESQKLTSILESSKQGKVLAVDIVYGRTTPFFALAHSMGIDVVDGIEMLLTQAALAGTHFFDVLQPNIQRLDKELCFKILSECAPV